MLRYGLPPASGFSLSPNTQKAGSASGWISHLPILCSFHFIRWALWSDILRLWEHALSAHGKIRNKHSYGSSPDFFGLNSSHIILHIYIFWLWVFTAARGRSVAVARGLSCHSVCGTFVMELVSPAFLFSLLFHDG